VNDINFWSGDEAALLSCTFKVQYQCTEMTNNTSRSNEQNITQVCISERANFALNTSLQNSDGVIN